MRDPARIDRVLAILAERWKATPDLRLGQLLLNFTGENAPITYNLEDDKWVEMFLRAGVWELPASH